MSWMQKNFDPKRHKIFYPQNKDKFIGHYAVARSSWEEKFMHFCDLSPQVLEFSSESIRIPYFDTTLQKFRHYYPDFVVKVRNKEGEIKVYVIEIKPEKQTKNPGKSKAKTLKGRLNEQREFERNMAKWRAAHSYCQHRKWEFKILTENTLF